MGETKCEKCGSILKTRNDGEGITWVSPCGHCKEELVAEIKRVGHHFKRSADRFLDEVVGWASGKYYRGPDEAAAKGEPK